MKKNQTGVGLIEVLVTVLIMATSLLALSALQMRSLQYNQSSYLRSQANILAYDIVDRMRLNRQPIALGQYNIDFEAAAASANALALQDLQTWRTNLQTLIPNGVGKITCDNGSLCKVEVRWAEQNSTGNVDNDKSTFTYYEQL